MSTQTLEQAVDWWQRQRDVRETLEVFTGVTLEQKLQKALLAIRLNRMAGARYRKRWKKPRKGDKEILNG